MKKILIAAVSLIALTSCGGGNPMYFDRNSVSYTDVETAELDSLSYAVGMNIGLGISIQNSHLELMTDVLCATIAEELGSKDVDYDKISKNSRMMSRFSMERSRPYQMSKRANAMALAQGNEADTVTLPEIYDEEFTREGVSKMFGVDIANYLRRMAFPLNTYWFFKAMKEAEVVESPKHIDSLMAITGKSVRALMSDYASNTWPEDNMLRTRKWLSEVASKDGVHSMIVEGDTLYYRIDVAGNGNRPQNITDTVAFSYEVYTRTGIPVESTAKRIEDLRFHIEQTRNNIMFADTNMRNSRIAQLEAQIKNVENLRIPLKNSIITGAQYAMKYASDGGEITIWMPATLAYGDRGNRVVGPNEGVVMRVQLKDVVSVTPEEADSLAKIEPAKSPVKIIPAPRPADKKPGKPVVLTRDSK